MIGFPLASVRYCSPISFNFWWEYMYFQSWRASSIAYRFNCLNCVPGIELPILRSNAAISMAALARKGACLRSSNTSGILFLKILSSVWAFIPTARPAAMSDPALVPV